MIKYIVETSVINTLKLSRKNNVSLIMTCHSIIDRKIADIRRNFDMCTFFLNSNKVPIMKYITGELGLDKKMITEVISGLKPNKYLRVTFHKNYPNYMVSNEKVVLL